jgi:hypothetical protein
LLKGFLEKVSTDGFQVITKQIAQAEACVASASLTTAFFIPDRFHSSAPEMIHGIHRAFLVLGALTVFSTIIFGELKSGDGDSVSQHKILQHAQ